MKASVKRETAPQKTPMGRPGLARRPLAAVALCALLLDPAVAAAAVPVAEAAEDIFSDLVPLASESLEHMRGGFRVGNLDINVGVTVTTSIQGLVDVTSNFSINAPGDLRNMSSEITKITRQATDAARDAVDAAREVADQAIADADARAAAAMAAARDRLQRELSNAPTPTAPTPPTPPAAPAPPAGNDGGTPAMPSAPTVTPPAVDVAVEVTPPAIVRDPAGVVSHVVSVSQAAIEDAPIPVSPETVAEIIHRVTPDGGHTSIITNRMDNVSIQQNVAVDLSVENFTAIQMATGIQQAVIGIAQQIGVLSLRR